MYVLPSLIVILISIFVTWVVKKQWRIKSIMMKNFPGPPIKFFVGSALDFVGDRGMLAVFKEYQKKYGDKVYTRVGPLIHTLIFTDSNLAKEVFQANINLSKGSSYNFTRRWLQFGLLTTTEDKWRAQRKMLTPAFNNQLLKDFLPTFDKQSDILIRKIEDILPIDSVNIHSFISLCSLDIICETSMGVSMGAQENQNTDYVTAIKEMCRIIAARSCSLLKSMEPFYIFTKDYRIERKCVKLLHNYTDKVIRERRKLFEEIKEEDEYENPKLNLLDILLTYSDTEKQLSEKDIRSEVHTFLFAGHDTVTAAMSFFVYEIAKHPNLQSILQEEQQSIFGSNKDAPIDSNDLPKMKYLEMAIKETLRFYPPVPVYTRKVTKEFMYDGKVIPAGITLTHFAYGLHRNAKYYEDPDTFNFLRFEDPKTIDPCTYLPFSTGPRNCIGQKFAMNEMKVILSKMIRNFEFRPAVPEHEIQLRAEVVLTSRNGMNVKVMKRQL